jgi:hypothetical protein
MSNELKRYQVEADFPGTQVSLIESDEGNLVFHSDALAAIEAAKPKWEPIETAPDEGEFLVWMPNERTKVQSCRRRRAMDVIGGCFGFDLTKPTHWMPFPPPPESE